MSPTLFKKIRRIKINPCKDVCCFKVPYNDNQKQEEVYHQVGLHIKEMCLRAVVHHCQNKPSKRKEENKYCKNQESLI